MTIEVSRFISPDLYVENASLNFDRHRVGLRLTSVPPLGALTFIAQRTDSYQKLQDLALTCGREAFLFVNTEYKKSYKGWLFVSDGPWREATRIALHQKLWKNHRDLIESSNNGHKSEEVAINAGSKVRYAGLLEITDSMIDKAIDSSRGGSSFAIIFSRRNDIDSPHSIQEIFSHGFTKHNDVEQTSIDWMALAISLCPKGDMLLRVSGHFDDREAAVDLIATPQNLPTLV